LGYRNIVAEAFDASGGWPEHAPFDVIVMSAGTPRIPAILLHQLRDGGRLVAPVGTRDRQVLTKVVRQGDRYITTEDMNCRYVDLVGRFGVGSQLPSA
jgi:protein-L-isoaspartate(D-aspartate) O-methyltransferase